MGRQRRLAALAAAFGAALLPAGAVAADELLPDLDQRAPYRVSVIKSGTRFRLVFASAVDNVGVGPLIVEGRRASRKINSMTADQFILRSDGSKRRLRGVGVLRFVESPDHRHWHYLGFDRYELRSAADFGLVAADRKTGFCLGDRYAIDPAAGLEPVFTTRCGLNGTGLLRLREGISPGFGDDYKPRLEGQYLELAGLEAGRYVLVHRANSDRSLLESDYENNAASVLLRLTRTDGRPRIAILAVCADSERCPAG